MGLEGATFDHRGGLKFVSEGGVAAIDSLQILTVRPVCIVCVRISQRDYRA
jgi:hypothetical protein